MRAERFNIIASYLFYLIFVLLLRHNRSQLEKRCQTLEEEKKQILIKQRHVYH